MTAASWRRERGRPQHQEQAKFILRAPNSSAGETVLLGQLDSFADLREAERALRAGGKRIVGGAIPFDPLRAQHGCSLYLGRPQQGPPLIGPAFDGRQRAALLPDRAFNEEAAQRYRNNTRRAIDRIRSPDGALAKAVLSRQERFTAQEAVDPGLFFARICAAYPTTANYFVKHLNQDGSLSYSLGASPELFLRKTGRAITMTPMAGTLPQNPALPPEEDRRRAAALLSTEKYLSEHRYLVDFIVERLRGFCDEIDYSPTPRLFRPPKVWHLGTSVHAELRDPETPVADLVQSLHPSPAVCGIPQKAARELIEALDSPRRYYGGLVGWIDNSNNCEFYLALRGVELDLAARTATLRAGGGIVAGSEAQIEFEETVAKMSTMGAIL